MGTIMHLKLMHLFVTYPLKLLLNSRKDIRVTIHVTNVHVKENIFLTECFPYVNNFHERTDYDFRLKLQEGHHTGTSILETIPNLDMMKDFPSDPLHLLYLGIVKTIVVKMWCNGKPRCKLSFNKISEISASLAEQKRHIPCEINRKTKSLSESNRWKGTEFRTFVLYTGPVVLKSVLDTDKYVNFLTLHVAITIL